MPANEPNAPSDVDEPLAMRWTLGRVLALMVALATIVFWGWIFSGGPKSTNPDRLDDRAYVTFAQQRCVQLNGDLAALPNAITAETATDRANVLDDANELVSAMVDDLEARAPTEGDDGTSMRGWIADWRTYVADREDYADRLREDPDALMQITENTELHDGVDKTIEIFADVNDMPECATPGDVG
ncbi:MAG: hypothetical protein ABI239_05435 [Aquihabitans sp.]